MSSSAAISAEQIEYYPDCTCPQIERVLGIMEKWSVRNAANVVQLRSHPRRELRGFVTAITDYHDPYRSDPDAPPLRLALRVPARNISQGGLGLIAPQGFVPQVLSDESPAIKTLDVFHEGVKLTIQLDRQAAPALIVAGDVVRVRPTHEGFFEIGVQFTERSGAPLSGAD